MSGTFRTLVSTLLLLGVFGGVYYALSSIDFFNSAHVTRDEVERRTQQIEQELVAQLDLLSGLSVDGRVFEMPEYASLVDQSVSLVKPPLERPDPFAAL